MDSLAERVNRLERQHRRYRLVGLLAMVGLGSTLAMGQATPDKPLDLEVRSLRVVDSEGKSRILLTLGGKGGASISLHSKDMESQVAMYANAEAAALFFMDSKRTPRLRLIYAQGRGVNLDLYDKAGDKRAELSVTDKSGPGLLLQNPNGDTKLFAIGR